MVEEASREGRILVEAQGMDLTRLVSMTSTRSSIGFDRNLSHLNPIVVAAARVERLMPARIVPLGVSISIQVSVEWEMGQVGRIGRSQ